LQEKLRSCKEVRYKNILKKVEKSTKIECNKIKQNFGKCGNTVYSAALPAKTVMQQRKFSQILDCTIFYLIIGTQQHHHDRVSSRYTVRYRTVP
jgi:hypothetical protein